MLIKQLTAFFLSFVLIFISTPSFAVYDPNAKHSKWFHDSIVNDPTVKSSVEVKASRTYPVTVYDPATGAKDTISKTQKSTIKLGAKANNVGKSLMKRSPTGVITQALIGLGIGAVDWLLDPENNSVKYKDPNAPKDEGVNPWNEFIYAPYHNQDDRYSTPDAACYQGYLNFYRSLGSYPNVEIKAFEPVSMKCVIDRDGTGSIAQQQIVKIKNPNYDPNAKPKDPSEGSDDYIHIPIERVAEQVIKDAVGGDAPAMQVMTDTALDMLEAGLLDAQLEAAAEPKQFGQGETDPTDQGQTPTNPTDPETPTDPENPTEPENPFELPPFCSWATKVCSFIDWMQAEPPDDTEVQLPEPDIPDVDSGIDFGGSCPDDAGFTMNIFGNDVEFVMMPFSKFCPLLDTYIKPVLVVLGSFMAVTIVGGRRDG